jgi:cytoskeleton-associated protein 5
MDLVSVLKTRLSDSNKNLAIQAAEICGNLAKSLGKPFDKLCRSLYHPLMALLADLKPQTKGATLEALDKIYEAVQLPCLMNAISSALMPEQAQIRKDLIKWLNEKLEISERDVDFSILIHPIFLSLQDKNADVRKHAQTTLNRMCMVLGAEHLLEKSGDLFKGAAHASLVSYLEPLRSTTTKLASEAPIKSAPVISAKLKPSNPKLKMKSASEESVLKKESTELLDSDLIIASSSKHKDTRTAADKGILKWAFEAPRKDLWDHLAEQSSSTFSQELHALLFSEEHYKEKDYLAGITKLDDYVSSSANSTDIKMKIINAADIILKYVTIRFFDTNTSIFLKVLELLEHLFALMEEQEYHLSDYEANAFLPFFINKVHLCKLI